MTNSHRTTNHYQPLLEMIEVCFGVFVCLFVCLFLHFLSLFNLLLFTSRYFYCIFLSPFILLIPSSTSTHASLHPVPPIPTLLTMSVSSFLFCPLHPPSHKSPGLQDWSISLSLTLFLYFFANTIIVSILSTSNAYSNTCVIVVY